MRRSGQDLAWGLATQGVAVARFDKITLADYDHPQHVDTEIITTIAGWIHAMRVGTTESST